MRPEPRKPPDLWQVATEAPADHPYLVHKGIMPHGARLAPDGRLIVPLYDKDGILTSLEHIAADGGKRFLKDGKVAGSFWILGAFGKRVFIAEGFAMAASIHKAMDEACAMAYSTGNLTATAKAIRVRYPAAEIVLVADNDMSGTGEQEACKAAEAARGRVVLCPQGDANDYAQAGGDLKALLGKPRTRTIVSMESLRTSDIPPRQWAASEMIPMAELSIIGARKRQGKTWFSLQAAEAISSGKGFLSRNATQGKVLYWPSELDATGMKERSERWPSRPVDLDIVTAGPTDLPIPRGQPCITEIESIITEGGYRVVILDMLGAFTPTGSDSNAYEISDFFLGLRRVAFKTGAAIVGTWHTGKSDYDDPALSLIGSAGIGGQVGSIITIAKNKGQQDVKVTVSGNHAREQVLSVRVDNGMFEDPEEADLGDIMSQPTHDQRIILDGVKAPLQGVSLVDLATALGKKTDTMRKALERMKEKGLAQKKDERWFAVLDHADTDKAG